MRASATGIGGLTVSYFTGDPESQTPTFSSITPSGVLYFDLRVSPTNTFTSVTLDECAANVQPALDYYDPTTGTWQVIQGASLVTQNGQSCVQFVFTTTTTPSIADLTGTQFAAPVVTTPTPTPTPSTPTQGYWEVTSAGDVYTFGSATFHGSTGNLVLDKPVVGAVADRATGGYWLVAQHGGVFSFDAPFEGSLPALPASAQPHVPVVGMAATPDGQGYWEVTSAGDVYTFGDAQFYGSLGNVRLAAPIVGIAAAPNGQGYWLVGADGGVFAFGDASYQGSLPGLHIQVHDITGIAADPNGGYWLVGSDGGVFSFGGAAYHGSLPGQGVTVNDVVGIAATPHGNGYRLVGADGGVFDFGSAQFEGSIPGLPASVRPPVPTVGIATAS
ncbi:hypothetical protein [Aciditerrimonas ferrireducens]|uniref:hypothetical protein n=1 Tax=Aciditerrimonas ferrireducens TaxID=667306 RepID=UPI00200325B7|nr:hypothetical protein [Aciditerrimonas ferrireducens]MCK4177701.1 hypothetical protein [Aciditerrimonas ferrireducens]